MKPFREIDAMHPDQDLLDLMSDDTTEADFDTDFSSSKEATLDLSSSGLVIFRHSNGVVESVLPDSMEDDFRNLVRGMAGVLEIQGVKNARWPGTMTVKDGKSRWAPDLNQISGSTELIDEALAKAWLVHNE